MSHARLLPESGAEVIHHGGATATFDGIESPITQTFGLGLFAPLTAEILDTLERFFAERNAPVCHEVCPLVGVSALDLLCRRGYRPIEIASVLAQTIPESTHPPAAGITVRVIRPDEVPLWSQTSAHAWSHEHPEYLDFIASHGAIMATREASPCFLAELDGIPAATASLALHQGVALFAGAATLPAFRRRGLQSALLEARLAYALNAGCDLAMMVAEAGSISQRNAERSGFRIAYTRLKWKLF